LPALAPSGKDPLDCKLPTLLAEICSRSAAAFIPEAAMVLAMVMAAGCTGSGQTDPSPIPSKSMKRPNNRRTVVRCAALATVAPER
jgi:hypothetical protein